MFHGLFSELDELRLQRLIDSIEDAYFEAEREKCEGSRRVLSLMLSEMKKQRVRNRRQLGV